MANNENATNNWFDFDSASPAQVREFEDRLIQECLNDPVIYAAYTRSLESKIESAYKGFNSFGLPGADAFSGLTPENLAQEIVKKILEGGVEKAWDVVSHSILEVTVRDNPNLHNITPEIIAEYKDSNLFTSTSNECNVKLLDAVERDIDHMDRYTRSVPIAELGEDKARDLIKARHREMIYIVDSAYEFSQKEDFLLSKGISINGAQTFIYKLNKYRCKLFEIYLDQIRSECELIRSDTKYYFQRGSSFNAKVIRMLKRIESFRKNKHRLNLEDIIKRIESLKKKIDDKYEVLQTLVEMSKDSGMSEDLRVTIADGKKKLNEIKELIDETYKYYLHYRDTALKVRTTDK